MSDNDNKPTIYFDLDGTLYDLYSQPQWLERLTVLYDATVYAAATGSIYNPPTLALALDALIAAGYRIGVVSWLAKNSNAEFDKAVRKVKRAWIAAHLPQASEVHIVRYGTPKHRVVKNKEDAIIIDDDATVRQAWKHGLAIDANTNILPLLHALARCACQSDVLQ